MTRKRQILLLAGALLAPMGARADKDNGEKQRSDRWEQQDRVWDDKDGNRPRAERVSEALIRRYYARNSEIEKNAWKDQKERDKERRDALKEREKDRKQSVREGDIKQRESQGGNGKDRPQAAKPQRYGDRQSHPRPTAPER